MIDMISVQPGNREVIKPDKQPPLLDLNLDNDMYLTCLSVFWLHKHSHARSWPCGFRGSCCEAEQGMKSILHVCST